MNLEAYQELLEFENKFYTYIANDSNYVVMPIPDENGVVFTDEEKVRFVAYAKTQNSKLIYDIKLPNGINLVFGIEENSKFAVIPTTEFSTHS